MKALAIILILCSSCLNALSQAGMLDTSFSNDGFAVYNFGNGSYSYSTFTTIQGNGKIVAGGSSQPQNQRSICISRFLSNGKIDTSFANNGGVIDTAAYGDDNLVGIETTQDDGILAFGHGGEGLYAYSYVIKFDSSGNRDLSFGNDGSVVLGGIYPQFDVWSAIVRDDGKIFMAGTQQDSFYFKVISLNSDGSFDLNFGNGGEQIISLTVPVALPQIHLFANQKILLAGKNMNNSTTLYVGLDVNGSIDASFGVNGVLMTDFPNTYCYSHTAVSTTDDIISVGYEKPDSLGNDIVIMKVNHSGVIDSSFGVNGMAGFDSDSFGQENYGVLIQPDGKILISGGRWPNIGGANEYFVSRYTVNGILDSTWGEDGVFFLPQNFSISYLSGTMNMDPVGRVLLSGYGFGVPYSAMTVCRLMNAIHIQTGVTQANNVAFKIYPNPNTGCFEIATESNIQQIEIFAVTGEVVMYKKIEAETMSIKVGSLPKGIYFVRVSNGIVWSIKKLIVN